MAVVSAVRRATDIPSGWRLSVLDMLGKAKQLPLSSALGRSRLAKRQRRTEREFSSFSGPAVPR